MSSIIISTMYNKKQKTGRVTRNTLIWQHANRGGPNVENACDIFSFVGPFSLL